LSTHKNGVETLSAYHIQRNGSAIDSKEFASIEDANGFIEFNELVDEIKDRVAKFVK